MASTLFSIFKSTKRTILRTLAPIYRVSARQKVAMFHTGRSGSTVLGRMLHDHPKIYWAGEILASQKVRQIMQANKDFDYAPFMCQAEFDTIKPVYGIEIKPSDLNQLKVPLAQFITHLGNNNYTHFIILERRNLLRRYLSYLIAEQSGLFHLDKTSQIKLHRISLDPVKLVPKLDSFANHIRQFKELLKDMQCLELTYEEDIEHDPYAAYLKVCAFLNMQSRPATPGLQRINPYPLNELIVNFDEVRFLLSDTTYAWMTEDK